MSIVLNTNPGICQNAHMIEIFEGVKIGCTVVSMAALAALKKLSSATVENSQEAVSNNRRVYVIHGITHAAYVIVVIVSDLQNNLTGTADDISLLRKLGWGGLALNILQMGVSSLQFYAKHYPNELTGEERTPLFSVNQGRYDMSEAIADAAKKAIPKLKFPRECLKFFLSAGQVVTSAFIMTSIYNFCFQNND